MNQYEKSNIDPSLLITALVDGEISQEEREILEQFKKSNPYLDKLEHSERTIKNLIKTKVPRHKAPEALKTRINNKLKKEALQKDTNITPIDNGNGNTNNRERDTARSINGGMRKYLPKIAIAASILLLAGIGYFSLQSSQSDSSAYSIEEYAMKHFVEHRQNLQSNLTALKDIDEAEQFARRAYNMSMVIPTLSQSQFKGVGYAEFVPGYETPYLVYAQPTVNETIFIFTFDVNNLSNNDYLKRNTKAVERCLQKKDYYVQNVRGKHVVSWKWENTWYTAISNHDGNQLAGLVNPLN